MSERFGDGHRFYSYARTRNFMAEPIKPVDGKLLANGLLKHCLSMEYREKQNGLAGRI